MFRRKGKWRTIRKNYVDLPQEEWSDDEMDHYWAHCSEEEYWAMWEEWSRKTGEHPKVKAVTRGCLDLALEAGKGSHPLEFACLLRIEGDTITEPVLLPGTVQGDEHAIFDMWMQPVDATVRGTLHSHPDPHPYPSDADVELFGKHGEAHIILCQPYGPNDWRAYDHTGQPIKLEVRK